MVCKMNPRGKTGFRADLSQQPQLHVSASVLALPSLSVGFMLNLTVKGLLPFQASYCQRKKEAGTAGNFHRIITKNFSRIPDQTFPHTSFVQSGSHDGQLLTQG